MADTQTEDFLRTLMGASERLSTHRKVARTVGAILGRMSVIALFAVIIWLFGAQAWIAVSVALVAVSISELR